MKTKILILAILALTLTSCNYWQFTEVEKEQRKTREEQLKEDTEKDIERCLAHNLGYIKHNVWQISCIPQGTSVVNIWKNF